MIVARFNCEVNAKKWINSGFPLEPKYDYVLHDNYLVKFVNDKWIKCTTEEYDNVCEWWCNKETK